MDETEIVAAIEELAVLDSWREREDEDAEQRHRRTKDAWTVKRRLAAVGEAVVPTALRYLTSSQASEVTAAIDAMAAVGDARWRECEQDGRTVETDSVWVAIFEHFRGRLPHETDQQIASALDFGLGLLDVPESWVVDMSRDENVRVRRHGALRVAARYLAGRNQDAHLRSVLQGLLHDEDPEVRRRADWGLTTQG